MSRYLDVGNHAAFHSLTARDVERMDANTLRRDTTPSEYNPARPRTCGGSGEMEVGTSRDPFGNWDTEVIGCGGCPDCLSGPAAQVNQTGAPDA